MTMAKYIKNLMHQGALSAKIEIKNNSMKIYFGPK